MIIIMIVIMIMTMIISNQEEAGRKKLCNPDTRESLADTLTNSRPDMIIDGVLDYLEPLWSTFKGIV